MEVLNSEYIFSEIQEAATQPLTEKNCVLWILHANKVPPHIGISVDAHYFSLKANGRDFDLPITYVIELIHKKQIETVCIELFKELTIEDAKRAFTNYSETIPNQITCLDPIKDLLECRSANQLSDLLSILKEKNQIAETSGFYVPLEFDRIKSYSVQQIHDRLSALAKKNHEH